MLNRMRMTLNRSLVANVVWSVLVVLVSTSFVFGQDDRGLLSSVPEANRTRLIERLNRFVEYERTREWDRFYDLLYRPEIGKTERREARKAFVDSHNDPDDPVKSLRIAFTPKIVDAAPEISDGTYLVRGCSTYDFKGKIKQLNDIILAHLVDDDWYFSSFGEVAAGDDLCKP